MASSGLERPPDQSLSQSDSTLERSRGSVSMVFNFVLGYGARGV